jgi:hypothetical protein
VRLETCDVLQAERSGVHLDCCSPSWLGMARNDIRTLQILF